MPATATQKASSSPHKRTTATTPLPPLAVAIGRMMETFGSESVDHEFARAWAKMPAIVAAYARGQSHSIDYVNAHGVIENLVNEAIAASRKGTESYDRRLAQAVDLLEADDLWVNVYGTVADRAFTVGVALGVYVALNGSGTR